MQLFCRFKYLSFFVSFCHPKLKGKASLFPKVIHQTPSGILSAPTQSFTDCPSLGAYPSLPMAQVRTPTSIGVNLVSGPTYRMQKTELLLLLRLSFAQVRCPECLNPQTFELNFLKTLLFSSPCQQQAASGVSAFLFKVNVACCDIANNLHRQLLACRARCLFCCRSVVFTPSPCEHRALFDIFISQMKNLSVSGDNVVS